MVGAADVCNGEIPFGFTVDGLFEIILRPVRGPLSGFRARTPPPPPPPPQPPRPPRTPSPPPPRQVWITVSDGLFALDNGSTVVRSNFTENVSITTDSRGRRTVREVGRRITKEEVMKENAEEPPAFPPFTSLMRRGGPRTPPPPRPPPPAVDPGSPWLSARNPPPRPPPPRWVSPSRQRPQSPPPPYQGLIVTERPQSPPPPYGEVLVEQHPKGVRVTPRISQDPPPAQPSAPPSDEGYCSGESRGIIRLHSISPFERNVRLRTVTLQEEIDIEAISCLLDFAGRGMVTQSPKPITTVSTFPGSDASQEVMVRTFAASVPVSTPSPAPRPQRPPRIASRRILPIDTPRPRPLRSSPIPAALGAPPRQEEEEDEDMELPDIPDTPTSPAVSDITVMSTFSSPCLFAGYDSKDDDEYLSEYEYLDPNEGAGAHSYTPPPSCNGDHHKICVPPAWGERIPGSPVICRCLLCHEENRHHPIRCVQCLNAPGCCSCVWGYMRSKYNSGCPLCRHGDPCAEDPLGSNQRRQQPIRREELVRVLHPRRRGRGRARGAMLVCGTGRGRGRGQEQTDQQESRAVR